MHRAKQIEAVAASAGATLRWIVITPAKKIVYARNPDTHVRVYEPERGQGPGMSVFGLKLSNRMFRRLR